MLLSLQCFLSVSTRTDINKKNVGGDSKKKSVKRRVVHYFNFLSQSDTQVGGSVAVLQKSTISHCGSKILNVISKTIVQATIIKHRSIKGRTMKAKKNGIIKKKVFVNYIKL